MLVLSRKENEEIVIGKDVVITVLGIRGNTVRLGITADKKTRIIRAELKQREQEVPCPIQISNSTEAASISTTLSAISASPPAA